MRHSLNNLFQQTIIMQYKLPYRNNGIQIPHTHVTDHSDDCLLQVASNDDIAKLIYNGIIDYSYNDYEIDSTRLDNLQIRALQSRLKYNPQASFQTQLSYGFQGEVMLYLVLDYFYHAQKAIARGHLFCPLENGETKGYDSYQMVEGDNGVIYLFFGEAKFYIGGYKPALEKIFEKISDVLCDTYLHRNFVAMESLYQHINPQSRIRAIIEEWYNNPLINMGACAQLYNMQLVYPMLVIFDNKANSYDELIAEVVNHIDTEYKNVSATLTIPHHLFFMFLSVNDARYIKSKVIEWISQRQPVMP